MQKRALVKFRESHGKNQIFNLGLHRESAICLIFCVLWPDYLKKIHKTEGQNAGYLEISLKF